MHAILLPIVSSPASLHALAIDHLSAAYWGVSSSKAEKHLHLKSSWTISIHLRHLSQPQNLEMRPRNDSKGMVVSRIGVSYWHLGLGIGPQPLRREMLIWITHFQYIESYAWLLENIFSCPEQLNRWPCHSLTDSLTNSQSDPSDLHCIALHIKKIIDAQKLDQVSI